MILKLASKIGQNKSSNKFDFFEIDNLILKVILLKQEPGQTQLL